MIDRETLELLAAALRASIATAEATAAQNHVALDVVENAIAEQVAADEEREPACPRCQGTEMADGGKDGAGNAVLVCPCGANVVNGQIVSG